MRGAARSVIPTAVARSRTRASGSRARTMSTCAWLVRNLHPIGAAPALRDPHRARPAGGVHLRRRGGARDHSWVAYPFAALLAWTGYRILRANDDHDEGAAIVDRIRRRVPMT